MTRYAATGHARRAHRWRWRLALVAPLLVLLAPRAAVAQVPPHAEWRTFDTPHFHVTFMAGLEPVARRAAERAEWAYALLATEFIAPPRGRVELVVADNVDLANGMASAFPRNRVIVYAHPPAAEPTLAYHEDWLELLLLHELVHTFHMDQAGGIWQPLRRVFGREPLLFPHVFSPTWILEGLATYFESEYTAGGRVRGTMFDMILRAAVLDGRFFSVDQVSLSPVTWPAGTTPYVYGSLFIDHLARRFGPAAIPLFIERAGSAIVPYRFDAAARAAFGETLTRAWAEWEDSLRVEYEVTAAAVRAEGLTEPEILTREGRLAFHPRFSPDGRSIAYSAATAREEASIRLLLPGGEVRDLVRRTATGPAYWSPGGDALVYAQLDVVDQHSLFSDVYVAGLDGTGRRVTRRGRVWDPHPHPDGRTAVGVASAPGTNVLARIDLATGEVMPLTEPSLDRYWSGPRWSPAGDRIAASRWRAGGLSEIVVLDAAAREVGRVTSHRAVDRDPAWSPDGRYLVFSSDRTGITNLFAHDVETGGLWQVTNVLTGAFQPDVSPDGAWIAFSSYAVDGYHVARIPFDPGTWRPAPPPLPRFLAPVDPVPEGPAPVAREHGGESRPYSAWRTLPPTRWSVAMAGDADLGFALGASTAGRDVVERHAWVAEALLFPADGRFAGGAAYRYRGWGNPVLELRADHDWRVQAAAGSLSVPGGEGLPDLLRREREIAATLAWNRRRWRSLAWLEIGAELRDVDLVWREEVGAGAPVPREFPVDGGAILGGGYSTVRAYGLSLGPQDGFLASARLQGRRYLRELRGAEGARREYWRLTSRNRAYRGLDWFGFAPPVLAASLNAGVESRAVTPGFTVGGTTTGGGSGGSGDAIDLFGSTPVFGARGYGAGIQRGNRAVAGTLEYRFPLLLVERGVRLFPVGLTRLWGDVFVDAAAAWCPEPCPAAVGTPIRSPDPLVSIGAEAIVELRLGFFASLPLRLGVGLPLREPGAMTPGFYVRVGPEF